MTTRKLVRTALFAALTAVGAFLKIPLGPSAITLQFFFTAMAGCLLGSGCGALSQLIYVLLGLLGLPIFTAGGSGRTGGAVCRGTAVHGDDPQLLYGQGYGPLCHFVGRDAALPPR